MKEITKERAEELDAAWNAATDTQRLSMNRMSWFGADSISYFEETPSKLELVAAARIKELETALRNVDLFGGTPYLVIDDGGDFKDSDTINVDLPVWVLRAIRKAVETASANRS